MSERVLVTGSRGWLDLAPIYELIQSLEPGTTVIVGDAERGADQLTRIYANGRGDLDVQEFDADWTVKEDTPAWAVRRRRDGVLYDVRAGLERNERMYEEGRPTRVVAFQRDGSSGTQDAIDRGQRRGLPVRVIEHGLNDVDGIDRDRLNPQDALWLEDAT